jgi:SAM-dependent methyltransferase
MADEKQIDWAKARKFSEQVAGDVAATMHAVMSYLGDRLGIFKAMAESGPVTVEQLASRTGLNERYIREWLGSMAASKYVEYRPDAQTYYLPPEHALSLADEDSLFFFGGFIGGIVGNISVAPKVAEAFKTGKGVPQSEYPPEVFESIERGSAPLYKHRLVKQWLAAMPHVVAKLEQGGSAADVGCGSGRAAITIAQAFPKAQVAGFDVHAGSIERARANAAAAGVADHAAFNAIDATRLPEHRFDFISTFEVVHDSVDPLGLMTSIRKALRPGGSYLMVELNVSPKLEENITTFGRMLYSVSTLYCMTVSLAHGGAGIGAVMGEPKARELATQAGFTQFQRLPIKDNFYALYELRA